MNKKLRELNKKLNLYEMFFRMEFLNSFPIDIGLPAGDRCNLKCVFCTDRGPDEKYKNVDFRQFLQFTEPLTFASYIQIQGWGEPLLNPDYEMIFDHVANRCEGARISFSTNGILLEKKWINKLTSHEDISISISLNASSKERYRHLMGKDSFDKIIGNIKSLIKSREEKGRKTPLVSVSFVCLEQNIHELPEFINLAADLGVDCVILRGLMILRKEHEKYALDNHSKKNILALRQALENARKRGIFLDTSSFPIINDSQNGDEAIDTVDPHEMNSCLDNNTACISPNMGIFNECYDPWTTFVISTEGYVKTCCYSDAVMGNIFEQGFHDIWNGEIYRYYRKNVNTSSPPEDCACCFKKR